ncbi:MAG: hypothetical protein ACD_63C00023G0003 [uncultured bacterium]|nr:MAG: hypothetical protein ACD_63C00023G0003 [uncultured bacterium]
MPRILAVDYGEKRIGLALSDESQTIAGAIDPLGNKGRDDLIKKIGNIVKRDDVEKIIVGLPVNLAGEEAFEARFVKEFSFFLEEKLQKKVIFEDERFSSHQAEDVIRQKGQKGKASVDSQAAQFILQAFLDRNAKK